MKGINLKYWFIGLVGLLFFGLVFFGCKSTKPVTNTQTTIKDSTIINYRNVDVPVPGQKTGAAVNLDSLMQLLKENKSPVINNVVPSTDGKMLLKYWTDEFGKLQIRCETQDYVLNVLAQEITKIRNEQKTVTVVQEVSKTPWYNWVIMILLLAALIKSQFKR